jgi:hypothetical protein
MPVIQKLAASVVFAAAFLFVSAAAAAAQELPDYMFLEVVDSGGKPVADATVEASSQSIKTNDQGQVKFVSANYKVSKPGYYPFMDLGEVRVPYRTFLKLELLKIPQTEKERKALGREELKRELMWAAKRGMQQSSANCSRRASIRI